MLASSVIQQEKKKVRLIMLSDFPLTGSHTTLNCQQCHDNGYSNTPVECVACHKQIYNESTNPNHQSLSLSTDCESCHTINPDWQPASFPVHEQYYLLAGGHLEVANDCSGCHTTSDWDDGTGGLKIKTAE